MAPTIAAVMFILMSMMLKSTNGIPEVVTNTEIPSPQALEFSSVNINPKLKWNYTSDEKYNDVTFFVEIADDFFNEWEDESSCQNISENQCDIVSVIPSFDTNCPQYYVNGEYLGRVRACSVKVNNTKCSLWTKAEGTLSMPGAISPPNFEVEGVNSSTLLLVRNHPFIVKLTNMSLNCYHDKKLKYEIKYWSTNDSAQKVQETSASFSMPSIALRLPQEPEADSELCVSMRIVHVVKNDESDWKTECVIYKREHLLSAEQVAVIAIATSVGGVVLIIILIIVVIKVNRMYKYVYSTKFEIPTDFAGLVNESLVAFDGNAFIEEVGKHHSEQIVRGIVHTNVMPVNLSTKPESRECDSSEVVYLLSPEALRSPDFPHSRKDEEVEDDLSSMGENGEDDTHSSDNESIPYVCSLEETESGSDPSNDFTPKCSASSRVLCASLEARLIQLPDLSHEGNEQVFATVVNHRLRKKYNSEGSVCEQAKPTALTEQRSWSASTNFLDKAPPEYAKVKFSRGSSLPKLNMENAMPKPAQIHHIQTCLLEKILPRACPDESTRMCNSGDDQAVELIAGNAWETEDDEQRAETWRIPTNNYTVCMDNPTYNPKPAAFDFIDDDCNGVEKDKSPHHFYNNVLEKIRIEEVDRPIIPNAGTTPRKNIPLHQRRLLKNITSLSRLDSEDQSTEFSGFNIPARVLSPRRKRADGNALKFSRRTKRRHSCSSGSATFSPARDRIVSTDSGYQMGSFSVSDECCMLSPPVSPEDMLFPDVFSAETSPKTFPRIHSIRRNRVPCVKLDATKSEHNLSPASNIACSNYGKTQYSEDSEMSPYVSVGIPIEACIEASDKLSTYIKTPY